jgi:CopG family nickel-responsive transcriptional regulator
MGYYLITEKMPVVSLSINETLLNDLDNYRKDMGYSGRSEAIRAGIRLLLAEAREERKLKGTLTGILFVIHDHEAEDLVSEIKHNYIDVIHTQLHNRFEQGKCLELFILNGEASRITSLTRELKRNEKNELVKLNII